ncbi:MAG: alpha-glucuronidase family glycosyl hydrolase [Candidatus Poribacteria bacterium]|nr:alpha-glucuronidase family glycosyl hydrolase [Candidatus Poribacteria bacterium]
MEYQVFITVLAVVALILTSELSNAMAAEPEGLVGRWNFDDGTGTDTSGNGNHAVLGGTKIYSLGEGHACIETMPKAEPMRIPVPENSPLAMSRGTICFWLNTISDRANILRYNNDAVELNTYRGCFQVRFQGEKDFQYWEGILDYDWPKYDMREWAFYPHVKASIGDSEWHLFAVAYDDKAKQIVGWRDGEQIATIDLSTADMEPLRREGLTEIHTDERFVGYLDDLRIYNKPLTDAEVKQIYDATKDIYAGRRDTNLVKRRQNTYKYQEIDRTLYKAWLQFKPPTKQYDKNLFKNIVAEGTNSTVQTASSELAQAIESMFGFKPSVSETATVTGPKVILGTAETSSWIRDRAEDLQLDRIERDGFVIKTLKEGTDVAIIVAGKIPAGVVFGTFDLIRRIQIGQDPLELDALENPQVPIRMVAHWSYFRGLFGDRWRGGGRDNSIFSWEELRTGDTKLIRDWVRMLASCGWNALCPSEINWHYRNNFLEHLDEVEKLGDICRDYGIKLYWSPNYLLALDPKTADALYSRVPDFGGYMMKLGSEKQNGDPRPPMVNRIADTLKPYDGKVLVRAFVYGNLRYTPEPYRNLIPYDLFAHEDGNFRDNVIIVPKGSPLDWDLAAPIPALDGAIQKNLYGSELVIDKSWPVSWVKKWKWWFEQDTYRNGPGSLNKFNVDCIMGVSMISPAPAWTKSPLNAVNYYGLGRLTWNPDLTVDEIYTEWIQQTFGDDPEVLRTIKTILMMLEEVTRKTYNYRGYRGIWLDSSDPGMAQVKTPYIVNREGAGTITPALRERVLAQYAPGLREIYGDQLRGEVHLTAFHFTEHDQRLSIGRTLIQDIYANIEEGVEMAEQAAELWKTLEGKVDPHRYEYTLKMLVDYAASERSRTLKKWVTNFEAHTGRTRLDTLAGLTAEALAEVGTYNVRHFGAVADGKSNDADSINRAIAACNTADGGTVFVPSGVYATGIIHLKNNVTLALDAGATLKALPDADAVLLIGENLENVNIYGPGTLNGIGNNAITLRHCKNVKIRNLNVHNGGNAAIFATDCDGVMVDNINIRTNQDGLNLSECRNVTVSDCRIDTGQREYGRPIGGGTAIKFDGQVSSSDNITVQNCFLANGGGAVASNTETESNSGNANFKNVRVHHISPIAHTQ